MPFSTRNAFYLRISSWTVLPLYLYLDERHVDWMTDQTLQAVLMDLRPKLANKFHSEDPNKKSTVDVHRGGSYQFAFFFRKTDSRHVVLLKKREYHMQRLQRSNKAGRETKSATLVPKFQQKRKREGQSATPAPRSRRVTRTPRPTPRLSSVNAQAEEEGLLGSTLPNNTAETADGVRRSARGRERVSYTEEDDHQDLDTRLEGFGGLRDQTPLFAEEDEADGEVQVKEEPLDEDDEMPLQSITEELVEGAPHLPIRTDSEIQDMREGAAAAGHRTELGTGLEDPEDGFTEHTEGRHIRGSPDPLETTGLDGMGDVEEEDGKEFKPVTRLSYSGFSISSRHLVLIIEPWPAIADLPTTSSRSRSAYSRSTRDFTGRQSTLDLTPGDRSQTPLVPNSRRGGTSILDRPTATPGPSGFGTSRMSATPAASFGRDTPAGSNRNASAVPSRFPSGTPSFGRGATPLFREATPFSAYGDDDQEEEEDDDWRQKAQNASWAPTRGGSEVPEGFGFRSGLADQIELGGENDEEDQDKDVTEARGMLAMSQRIQEGTSSRRSGAFSSRGEVDGGDGDIGDDGDAGAGEEVDGGD